MDFPCTFPIKMMGRDDPGFRATALELIRQHVGEVDEGDVRTSRSRNGTFLSVTVTITATSQEQLDTIYNELTAHESILVAL